MSFNFAARPRTAIELDRQRTILRAQAEISAAAGHINRPVLRVCLNLTIHVSKGSRAIQTVSLNGAGEVTD